MLLSDIRFNIHPLERRRQFPTHIVNDFQRGVYLDSRHYDPLNTPADDKLDFLDGIEIVRVNHGNDDAFAVGRYGQYFVLLHLFERKQIYHRVIDFHIVEIYGGKTQLHAERFLKFLHLKVTQCKQDRTEMLTCLRLDL
jgi:hypothetical protein